VTSEIANNHYVAFLDDDDEQLPWPVDLRIRCLDGNPEAAALVSNGSRSHAAGANENHAVADSKDLLI
jgi:hypothetical protein